jgi:hypothetical protein
MGTEGRQGRQPRMARMAWMRKGREGNRRRNVGEDETKNTVGVVRKPDRDFNEVNFISSDK